MKVFDNRFNNGWFIFEVALKRSCGNASRIGNIQNRDALNTTVINKISCCRDKLPARPLSFR